jgi:IMP dehydrogenase/GMP reductase
MEAEPASAKLSSSLTGKDISSAASKAPAETLAKESVGASNQAGAEPASHPLDAPEHSAEAVTVRRESSEGFKVNKDGAEPDETKGVRASVEPTRGTASDVKEQVKQDSGQAESQHCSESLHPTSSDEDGDVVLEQRQVQQSEV